MNLPLRLSFRPSVALQLIQISGHVLVGTPVFLWGQPLWGVATGLLLLVSLIYVVRSARRQSGELHLHDDGTLSIHTVAASQECLVPADTSRVWSRLIVLEVEEGARPVLLLKDSFEHPDDWRHLQIWLRWVATPKPEDTLSSAEAE